MGWGINPINDIEQAAHDVASGVDKVLPGKPAEAVTNAVFHAGGEALSGAVRDVAAPVASGIVRDVAKPALHAAGTAFTTFSNADRRVYTDFISHPLATVGQEINNSVYGLETGQGAPNPFAKSTWIQSWQQAAHISPGQEVALGFHNLGMSNVVGVPGTGGINQLRSGGPDLQPEVNPSDPNAVHDMFNGGGNTWGNKMISGTADAYLSFRADPAANLLGKANATLKVLKNNPIKNGADIDKTIASPKTQRFMNWVGDKTATQVAQHPILRSSPHANVIGAALAGSTPAEAEQIMRIGMGDMSAFDRLSTMNPASAFRAANAYVPQEGMEKLALSPGVTNPQETGDLTARLESAKAASAQAALNDAHAKTAFWDNLQAHVGALTERTTSSALAEKSAVLREKALYATHGPQVTVFGHSKYFDTPVRVLHAFTDAVPDGLINHNDDNAVRNVRSWLNMSKILTPAEKADYATKYAAADKIDRATVWEQTEREANQKVFAHYGIDPADADHVLERSRAEGQSLAGALKQHKFGTITTASGNELPLIPTGDGEAMAAPQAVQRLVEGAVPMHNLSTVERALKQMDRGGVLGTIGNMGNKAVGTLTDVMDNVYGVWKPLQLMSMHRAYNHIGDDLLRGIGKVGGLTMAQNAIEGTSNFMRNRVNQLTGNMFIRNLAGHEDQMTATAKAKMHGLQAQFKDQQVRMAKGETIEPSLQVTKLDLHNAKVDYANAKTNAKYDIKPKNRIGQNVFYAPRSGVKLEEAFGGPNSNYLRNLTSSHQTWSMLANDSANRDYLNLVAKTSGDPYRTITPADGEKVHMKAYVDHVNNRLMNNPVAVKLLKGQTTGQVSSWLEDSPAGQSFLRQLHVGYSEPVVQNVKQEIDRYLPTDYAKESALKGQFGPKQVKDAYPEVASRPEVNGDVEQLLHGQHAALPAIRRVTDKALHLTGTLPDDIMVRHPLFNEFYKSHMGKLVDIASDQKGQLSTDELNILKNAAVAKARKDLTNLVYDTSRFNNAGHMLRFISPFFNAWYNAMGSWSKLFMENPRLFARTAEIKRGIWSSPFMVDSSTGQQATGNTSISNLYFVAHLPKALADRLPGGQYMRTLPISASKIISPTYADSVGNPGFGPLVNIPANVLAKNSAGMALNPLIESMLGDRVTKNSLSQLIPSAATQALDLAGLAGLTGDDATQTAAKLTWSIYQEQMYDYQNGTRSNPPTIDEAGKIAGHLNAMDGILNRLMPLGFSPEPTHQYFIDQYDQMLQQDPQNAKQNFYNKFGDAPYIYTQSLDKNVAGIPATAGAIKAYQQYKGILSQYPELGAVVVGPQGNGSFDQMAYNWEVANGLRTKLTPQEAATQAKVNLGWAQFDKINSNIQAQLKQRGLTSVNQTGAEDLKALKKSYTDATGNSQSKYYNPDWFSAYGSFDQNTYQNRISALESIATNKTLLANPLRSDVRSLNAYFQLRDQAYAWLQQRPSQSLKATANADIANWLDYYTGKLEANDTKFGPLYERYLKSDNFSTP